MGEWITRVIGWGAGTFGVPAVIWFFAQVRKATNEWKVQGAWKRHADDVLRVVFDSGEVLGINLVESLKDGKLEGVELRQALHEAYEFLWSIMRNADKEMLAGGLTELAKTEFEAIATRRIEGKARELAWHNKGE